MHLDNVTKVFPLNVVVCFDEDLSQDGLANRIVFGIELVKAVKGVAVLGKELERCVKLLSGVSLEFDDFSFRTRQHRLFLPSLTACMSRVSTLRSKAVRFMLSNTSISV